MKRKEQSCWNCYYGVVYSRRAGEDEGEGLEAVYCHRSPPQNYAGCDDVHDPSFFRWDAFRNSSMSYRRSKNKEYMKGRSAWCGEWKRQE